MPRMRMQLLGGFRLESEPGTAVTVSAKKARALLSYLALQQGQPQARDRLAHLFWGNSDDAHARSSLRQALMLIRRCLPESERDRLEADSEFVTLQNEGLAVDACELEQLAEAVEPQSLERAVALYQGELLQSLHTTAPEFEDWLSAQQRRYRQIFTGALERLLEHYEASSDGDRATDVAARLVAHDPLNEEAHRKLILLLASSGNLNAALRQYNVLRDVLERELGVAPAAETEQLYRSILERRRSGEKTIAPVHRVADATARPEALPASDPEVTAERTADNPAPSEAAKPSAGAELRHVAVLFADLSNFTSLSGRLWAEETHALLNRYFEVTDGVIAKYGGTIDKHIGDNVMAIFGAPVAHSNDSERAVRAALEIRGKVAALSEELGHPLDVHIGIASGQVIASKTGSRLHRAYTVIGESVNLAARLQDLAGPSEILVSDELYRTVAPIVQGEPRNALQIQGLKHSTKCWRIVDLHSVKCRAQTTSFVGRDFERDQFLSIVKTSILSGRGRVVYLRGEAGIGKSRLLQKFAELAEGIDCQVHAGVLQDLGTDRGRNALRDITQTLLQLPAGFGPEELQEIFEAAVLRGWLTRDGLPFLYDLLDLPQPSELESLHEAMDGATRMRGKAAQLSKLIEGRSAEQPLLIVIDDVHWADSRTLSILAGVAATVRTAAAVMVMTSRIVEDPIDRSWVMAAQGVPLTTLDLTPLSCEESQALARQFSAVDPKFSEACIARADGNPLFLDQLLRCYGRRQDELPGSIQSIVTARFDELAEGDKLALQAASVLGQRFTLTALRFVIEDEGYDCSNLMDLALVRAEDEEHFAFCHALIHEAVYGAILKSERDQLHLAAAKWFDAKDPVLFAEHLERADSPDAAAALLKAARNAAAKYHFGAAYELANRGLARSQDRELSHSLSLLCGFLLRAPGSVQDSIEMYENALAYADDDAQKCRAWTGIAEGLRVLGDYDKALEILELAEQAALCCDDDRSLARIYSLTGSAYFPLGRFQECLDAHENAILAARRAGSVFDEARALSGLGDAHYQRGHYVTAYGYFHRCIELCQLENIRELQSANLPMRGLMSYYMLDFESMMNDCMQAVDIGFKVNNYRGELLAHLILGAVLLHADNPASAYEHAERGLELARQLGSRIFEAESLLHKTQALARLDKIKDAEDRLLEAYRLSVSAQREYCTPWILSTIAVETEDAALRKWALTEGEALLQQGCVSHNYLHFYKNAIDAALAGGDWDAADRYATLLEDYTTGEPLPWAAFYVARGRALADFGRGLRDGTLMGQLESLRDDALRVGLKSAAPALSAAIASDYREQVEVHG